MLNLKNLKTLKFGNIFMYIFYTLFFLLSLVNPSFSQASEARLKNGQIIIDQGETSEILDYSSDNKYTPVQSEKWRVEKQTDKVQEALNVYKKKSEIYYDQKVLLINKSDGTEKIFIEYVSPDKEENIIFTNDDTAAFYWGLSDDGLGLVYRIDLGRKKTEPFASGSGFFLQTCPDTQVNYVVVQDDEGSDIYTVFSESGKKIKEINYSVNPEEITDAVCY